MGLLEWMGRQLDFGVFSQSLIWWGGNREAAGRKAATASEPPKLEKPLEVGEGGHEAECIPQEPARKGLARPSQHLAGFFCSPRGAAAPQPSVPITLYLFLPAFASTWKHNARR